MARCHAANRECQKLIVIWWRRAAACDTTCTTGAWRSLRRSSTSSHRSTPTIWLHSTSTPRKRRRSAPYRCGNWSATTVREIIMMMTRTMPRSEVCNRRLVPHKASQWVVCGAVTHLLQPAGPISYSSYTVSSRPKMNSPRKSKTDHASWYCEHWAHVYV